MGSPKKLSEYIPVLFDQGMTHLAGATTPGVSIQVAEVAIAGGSTAVTFEGMGMQPMHDAEYHVFIGGEPILGAATPDTVPACDRSTRTVSGFTIVGGGTCTVSVLVVGRVKDQAA